jgi:hypothetical protein
MNIDIYINTFENNYYVNLFNYLSTIKNNQEYDELIISLKNIINDNNLLDNEKVNDLLDTKKDTNSNLLDNLLDKDDTNILTDTVEGSDLSVYYKKSWTKLNNIHKILKIKEFINNSILDSSKKHELIMLLTDLVKTKILTKKNMVDYDEENCKILSINNLEISKTNYKYKNN